jgi:hypothetical protein
MLTLLFLACAPSGTPVSLDWFTDTATCDGSGFVEWGPPPDAAYIVAMSIVRQDDTTTALQVANIAVDTPTQFACTGAEVYNITWATARD